VPILHYKVFIDIVKKHKNDPDEAINELKTILKVQPEVNIIATHRILLFLNNLSKSWWTSQEHEGKIRNEFVHYILRSRIGSIESGSNILTTKELKKIFMVYDFLVEHVYFIYGVIEDDGTSQLFLNCDEKLLIKKEDIQKKRTNQKTN